MTLPASFPLSMTQIAAEIGKTLPLSLLDPWVVALAGKRGAPVGFTDLLGKTGSFNGSVTIQMGSGVNFGNRFSITPLGSFFGATISGIDGYDATSTSARIIFNTAPNWTGNIKITNQSSGASGILIKQNSTTWQTTSAAANTIPGAGLSAGQQTTATMLIQPSN